MYQALYRKWRPGTFDEVCGQEHITSVLKYEIASGEATHAYLFSGSRGTGKTTCAKILSKAVNCLSPNNGDPCGECEACRLIERGEATDILEMDAASNTGVDYIREIRDDVVYAPTALKNRVYIIDEVHMLSGGAFNALLKTLEEPPSHVVFILATTEPHKIPATILSRCQHFEFRRIASGVIVERLRHICREEDIAADDDALGVIAKLSLGGMRDAISLLELCAAGGEGHITVEAVDRVAGVASRSTLYELAAAVKNGDNDRIFGMIEELHASSKDIGVFFSELLEFYRDLLVAKTAPAVLDKLDLTSSELEQLKKTAPAYSREQLLYHCSSIEKAFSEMQRYNSNKRIIAELALVKLSDPALDDSTEALLARMSALEDKLVLFSTVGAALPLSDTSAASAPQPSETKPEEPKAEAVKPTASPVEPTSIPQAASVTPAKVQTPASDETRKTLRQLGCWIEAVKKFSEAEPLSGTYLNESKAYVDDDGRVYIRPKNSFAPVILDKPSCRSQLAAAIITSSGGSRVVNADTIVIQKAENNTDNEKFNYLEELAEE